MKTRRSEDQYTTNISSQINPKFGALFDSISKKLADSSKIEMADLVVGKQFIYNYLESLHVDKTLEKIPPNDDDILAQPSTLGMALVANSYNKQDDQHCRILIASTMEDYQHLISQVNAESNDNKAIVIFQPTNIKDEWKKLFFPMHKAVIYLEKKGPCMHMLFADSTPFDSIKEVCMLLADEVLQNTKRVYYTQAPIFFDSEKKKAVSFQTDFWNCGAHAFRMSRIIAQDSNFLNKLNLTSTSERIDGIAQISRFALPPSFAKCADAEKSRNICGLLFAESYPALAAHYAKHNKDYSYIIKFTRKYIASITADFLENTQEKLKAIIENSDARNFKPEIVKPSAVMEKKL